ncbi:PRC-barrel domain-containing protein [Rhodococcus sp. X156]|uniref:PRC-barrel domain-containing protein n=1 Tax=Rhodococcus sp. X156 TaxID=2499145 RepID=UPI001F49E3CB|nr:PRC-barrel domain-containing protein [Rhodococcus sp. X156]
MITRQDLGTIGNGTVHDVDGHKIGAIGQIYLDNSTGEPAWVTVRTGLFGTRDSFVPLAEASVDGDDLRVPYPKSMVKDAPNVEADGELTPAEEDQLYRYYGVDNATGQDTTTGQAAGQDQGRHAAPVAPGHGQDAGQQHSGQDDQHRDHSEQDRSEQGEESGRRIRRYLVTEETIVRREEIPDADAPDSHR